MVAAAAAAAAAGVGAGARVGVEVVVEGRGVGEEGVAGAAAARYGKEGGVAWLLTPPCFTP